MQNSLAMLHFAGFYGFSLAAAFTSLWIGDHRQPGYPDYLTDITLPLSISP